MLSSQQRLLLRAARRKLPSRNSLVFSHQQQQQQHGNTLSAFSSCQFFHSTSSSWSKEDDANTSTTATTTRGMPLIQASSLSSLSLSTATLMLQRSHPHHHLRWFSTESAEKNPSYKDRAAHYREQASHQYDHAKERATHYSDQAKDGAKTFGGMMKLYGPAFVGTYMSVYFMTLGGLYVGVESGVLDPVILLGYVTGNHEEVRSSTEVVAELLEHYSLTERFADTVREKPHYAKLAVAWISTKFTEPIRIAVTAAVVPRVARYFGIGPYAAEKQEMTIEEEDFSSNETEKATKADPSSKTEVKSEEKKLQ